VLPPVSVTIVSHLSPQYWGSTMTPTPTRTGMPGHFGIRITDANKDKLVGELDVDDLISTTAATCMAVRWRHSPTISAEHWPGLTSHLGFGQPRSSRRRISFAPASRGGSLASLYRFI
jgi:hypothetical protein